MPQLPENTSPAELYYNDKESLKYHKNTRISKIQQELSNRAIELLEIEEDYPLILDIGCGSGLSGSVLNDKNYEWIGVDISYDMLSIASNSTKNFGLICSDIGYTFPFKEESFDYAISISAIQWLFQSFKKEHNPQKRIKTFFKGLYSTIKRTAVLQFYCSEKQIEILKKEAIIAGFDGGLVVDNENTKNCKKFLVLNKFKRKNKY